LYLTLTASKDTYITNKIISNAFSASDANTGKASTIDLFKLYDESFLTGVDNPVELSRGLIKFDFERIEKLSRENLNLDGSDFKCTLELFDIMGGQVTPTNFTLMLFPLSQSFDEGIGKNVVSFSDLDVANFVTASYKNASNVAWYLSGANAQGTIDKTSGTGYPADIDIIVSGNLNDGNGTTGLGVSQLFKQGSENLSMDVTTIVSATIAGVLPDCGWRLSFTGSEENDAKTRFVKRFASRHVRDKTKIPRLVVTYDDTIKDQHQNLFFDLTGSVFLKNFKRGIPASILSGTAASEVTGTDCMILKIESGSYSKQISASQHQAGTKVLNNSISAAGADTRIFNYMTGVYSASFAISSQDTGVIFGSTRVIDFVIASGSITFDEIWGSVDGKVGYYTGSLTVGRNDPTSFNIAPKRLDMIVTNAKNSYKSNEKVMFRVFVRDFAANQKAARLPYNLKSVILEEVYYRIRDIDDDYVWVPFEEKNNATRLSSDSKGMFFETYVDYLPKGRTYTIDFLIKEAGLELIQEAKNVRFRVD
tara:strand:- start:15343 stop:16950 length:1608 start_codon:yes stop_codon:yes gene_type:complete